MKPMVNNITGLSNQTFMIEECQDPNFRQSFHYLSEFELILITKGNGIRIIGNSTEKFRVGDLVLVSKNQPYQFRCDQEGVNPSVTAIVLKFDSDLKGTHLFDLPEHQLIRQMLTNASRGFFIGGRTQSKVAGLMKELLIAAGLKRILLLLTILNELSESKDMILLNHEYYLRQENNLDRMNMVCDYIDKNFLGEISLPDAAYLANMHTSSFCRYFKKRYGKTFIQLVSQLRIDYACAKLINDDINIAEVCYLSGFNNLSNFTKIFKKITGVSPKEYKKKQLSRHLVA